MGLREYSRHRQSVGLPGSTHRAVQKALETNRITSVLDEKGRQKIDPEVADIQWGRNTDPDQSARANPGKEPGQTGGEKASGGKNEEGNRYWEAKTSREEVELARARLALEKDAGHLVDKDGVYRAGADAGRQLRDMMLSLPARVAAELAVMTDARSIEVRLREELRKVLDQLSRMAADRFTGNEDRVHTSALARAPQLGCGDACQGISE